MTTNALPDVRTGKVATRGGRRWTVLGAQVLNGLALVAAKPTRDQQNEELKGSGGCHGRWTIAHRRRAKRRARSAAFARDRVVVHYGGGSVAAQRPWTVSRPGEEVPRPPEPHIAWPSRTHFSTCFALRRASASWRQTSAARGGKSKAYATWRHRSLRPRSLAARRDRHRGSSSERQLPSWARRMSGLALSKSSVDRTLISRSRVRSSNGTSIHSPRLTSRVKPSSRGNELGATRAKMMTRSGYGR